VGRFACNCFFSILVFFKFGVGGWFSFFIAEFALLVATVFAGIFPPSPSRVVTKHWIFSSPPPHFFLSSGVSLSLCPVLFFPPNRTRIEFGALLGFGQGPFFERLFSMVFFLLFFRAFFCRVSVWW